MEAFKHEDKLLRGLGISAVVLAISGASMIGYLAAGKSDDEAPVAELVTEITAATSTTETTAAQEHQVVPIPDMDSMITNENEESLQIVNMSGNWCLRNAGSGFYLNFGYQNDWKKNLFVTYGDNSPEQIFQISTDADSQISLISTCYYPMPTYLNCFCHTPADIAEYTLITMLLMDEQDATQYFYLADEGNGFISIRSAKEPELAVCADSYDQNAFLHLKRYSVDEPLMLWGVEPADPANADWLEETDE